MWDRGRRLKGINYKAYFFGAKCFEKKRGKLWKVSDADPDPEHVSMGVGGCWEVEGGEKSVGR